MLIFSTSGRQTFLLDLAVVAGVGGGTSDAAGVRLAAYGGGIEHFALAAADLLPHSGAAVAHIERVAFHGVCRDNVTGATGWCCRTGNARLAGQSVGIEDWCRVNTGHDTSGHHRVQDSVAGVVARAAGQHREDAVLGTQRTDKTLLWDQCSLCH